MKIIFENKEEKDLFVNSLLCPGDLNLPIGHKCNIPCEECWAAVVDFEVKSGE